MSKTPLTFPKWCRSAVWRWGLLAAVLVAASIYYYTCDPLNAGSHTPRCVVFSLTGFRCPGCGLQRALHAALHGHLWEAWQYNFFLPLALALLLFVVIGTCIGTSTNVFSRVATHRYVLYPFAAIYILWWVLRNVLNL